jgi:hypothetical protein
MIRGDRDTAVMLSGRHGGRNRVLYAVKHVGGWLPVVFDAATASVLTVLPARALDHYRLFLDPPPEPPAVPRPEPFTGRITGFVPLPWSPASVLAGLPGVPEVADDAGLDEIDAALAALAERKATVFDRIGEGGSSKARHNILAAEGVRLGELHRRLRAHRHRVYTRRRALAFGGDPDDPLDVLGALFAAFRTVGERHGWGSFTQPEHEARRAAEYLLEKLGRFGVSAAEREGGQGE